MEVDPGLNFTAWNVGRIEIMGLLEQMMSLNLQESYPAYKDFAFLPFLVAFFPTVRFLLDRFVFELIAQSFIPGKGDVEGDGRRKLVNKFKESAWKFVYFMSSEIFILSVTYNEPWFTDTKMFWAGPGDQAWPLLQMKFKLKAAYMYAAGFYTFSIFGLLFWETRRSDFGVSMSHHIATVILIVLSYVLRFGRVGSMVLALHDATDIFLEIAKMSKYCGRDDLAQLFFAKFVVVWTALRLVYFPFWIIRSTSYEVTLTLDKEKHKQEGPIYYYIFNTLLLCLLFLHIYWSVLIFRMIVKQLQLGNISDDVRSDSEGEDHED
ncbi:ASC1-like protein [Wolffia australiana]